MISPSPCDNNPLRKLVAPRGVLTGYYGNHVETLAQKPQPPSPPAPHTAPTVGLTPSPKTSQCTLSLLVFKGRVLARVNRRSVFGFLTNEVHVDGPLALSLTTCFLALVLFSQIHSSCNIRGNHRSHPTPNFSSGSLLCRAKGYCCRG